MSKRKTYDAPCPGCGTPIISKVGDHCWCGEVLDDEPLTRARWNASDKAFARQLGIIL